MKHTLVLLFAFLSTTLFSNLSAQNGHDKISWSPSLDVANTFMDIGMVGNAKDGYVRIFEQNNTNLQGGIIIYNGNHGVSEIILKAVNSQMKVTASFKMDKLTLSKSISTVCFAEMKSNVYWIYSCLDEEMRKFYAYKINLKTAKFDGQPILLVEMDKNSRFSESQAADSSSFLIQYQSQRNKREGNKVGVCVFNEKMKKTSAEDYILPFKDEEMYLEQKIVDENANVYFLLKVRDPNHNWSKLTVVRYRKSEKTPDIIPVGLGDKQPQSFKLTEDLAGHINLMGYYFQNEKAIIGGMYLFQLNAQGKAFENIGKGFYELPESLMIAYETSHAIKKSEKGIQVNSKDKLRSSSLGITEFITHSDGSRTIIGEVHKSDDVFSTHSSATIYDYDDLVIARLNPAGEMIWVKRLPKNQQYIPNGILQGISGACSYKAIVQGNNLYLLYMDTPKNEKSDPNETPVQFTLGEKASFYCVKYDGAGLEARTILLEDIEFKNRINLLETRIAEPNQLIGFGGYPKDSRMCKIKVY
jgi:hypothetical protein